MRLYPPCKYNFFFFMHFGGSTILKGLEVIWLIQSFFSQNKWLESDFTLVHEVSIHAAI